MQLKGHKKQLLNEIFPRCLERSCFIKLSLINKTRYLAIYIN